MKTILFKWIFVALVLIIAGVVIFNTDNKPGPPLVPNPQATQQDNTTTEHQLREIAKKDSLINALEVKLANTTAGLSVQNGVVARLKIGVDTLLKFYKKNHNLHTCDSVVATQQQYIGELEQECDSLDSEARQYSRLLYVERSKIANKDSIITSHKTLIVAYQQQISRINCMETWTDTHRFWSWILGIKCKPPN